MYSLIALTDDNRMQIVGNQSALRVLLFIFTRFISGMALEYSDCGTSPLDMGSQRELQASHRLRHNHLVYDGTFHDFDVLFSTQRC